MSRISSRNPWVLLLIVVFVSTVAGGCTNDSRPIERRLLIMGVAFEQGDEKPVKVTLDAHNPKQSDANTQIGPPKTLGPPIITPTAEGNTVEDCIRKMTEQHPRVIDFGLTSYLVFDEKLAQEGILPYISWAMFQPSLQQNAYVLMTPSDCRKMFLEEARTAEGTQGGNIVVSQLNSTGKSASIATIRLWEIYRAVIDHAGDAIVPLISSIDGKIDYRGSAVLRSDRLVGRLNSEETALITMLLDEKTPYSYTMSFPTVKSRGDAQEKSLKAAEKQTRTHEQEEQKGTLEGKNQSQQDAGSEGEGDKSKDADQGQAEDEIGGVKIDQELVEESLYQRLADADTGWATLRIKKVSRQINVRPNGDKGYAASIDVKFESSLADANPPKPRYLKKDFEAMERKAEKELQEKIVKLLTLTQQEYKADLLHLGRRIRAKDIYYWQNIKWHEEYPKIPIEVTVKMTVTGATR